MGDIKTKCKRQCAFIHIQSIKWKDEGDCEAALELNKKLKSELNSYEPCPVLDYVKQTAKTDDIKKTVTEMHRKVDINQLMKKTYIKQRKGIQSGYSSHQ